MAAPTVEARVSPTGFVAQRMPNASEDHPWFLLHIDPSSGLTLQRLTDEDVADWPHLTQAQD